MRQILLLIIGLNSLIWADFTRTTTGIVTDNTTSLQWQDDTVGDQITWQEAIDHCETLPLGGFDDWRVPNIRELQSIRDRNENNPAIDGVFINIGTNIYASYWSSTSVVSRLHEAWNVDFEKGRYVDRAKSKIHYVRCVRGGQ